MNRVVAIPRTAPEEHLQPIGFAANGAGQFHDHFPETVKVEVPANETKSVILIYLTRRFDNHTYTIRCLPDAPSTAVPIKEK